MRAPILVIYRLLLTFAVSRGVVDTVLEPGKVITLTFPELPPTLYAMKNPAAPRPRTISVRLPDNYSRDRSFPLFVFLNGGWGNIGSEVDRPMAIVGKSNYVLASFPLFKNDKSGPAMLRHLLLVLGVHSHRYLQRGQSAYVTEY